MTDRVALDRHVDAAVVAASARLTVAARSAHDFDGGLAAVRAAAVDQDVHGALLRATEILVRSARQAHNEDAGLAMIKARAAGRQDLVIHRQSARSDQLSVRMASDQAMVVKQTATGETVAVRPRGEGREDLTPEVVIRRTSTGWKVEGSFPSLPTDTVDDLSHALGLADLLADGTVPGPRPPRPTAGLDEVAELRASVRQLEHALASRAIVEQAIGVLSERWRVAPRDAFEQLRRVTRSHGLRIHDLARLVIDSSTDPGVGLPAELVVPTRSTQPPDPRPGPDERPRRRRRRMQHGEAAELGKPEGSYASDR